MTETSLNRIRSGSFTQLEPVERINFNSLSAGMMRFVNNLS
jgi:hypothetical protein